MITRLNWRAAALERHWAIGIIIICMMILLTTLIFWPHKTTEQNTTPAQAAIKQQPKMVKPHSLPKKHVHINTKTRTIQKSTLAPTQHQPHPKPHKRTTTSHETPDQTGYFIQIGAFRNQQRAKALQRKLLKHHWRVSMTPTNNHLYSVKIGIYTSKKSAQKAKLKLLHTEKIKGFITHHQAHAKH